MDIFQYIFKSLKTTQIITKNVNNMSVADLYDLYKKDPNKSLPINIYNNLFKSIKCVEDNGNILYIKNENYNKLQFMINKLNNITTLYELKLPNNCINNELLQKIVTTFK